MEMNFFIWDKSEVWRDKKAFNPNRNGHSREFFLFVNLTGESLCTHLGFYESSLRAEEDRRQQEPREQLRYFALIISHNVTAVVRSDAGFPSVIMRFWDLTKTIWEWVSEGTADSTRQRLS